LRRNEPVGNAVPAAEIAGQGPIRRIGKKKVGEAKILLRVEAASTLFKYRTYCLQQGYCSCNLE
jgi:hypothetical protein